MCCVCGAGTSVLWPCPPSVYAALPSFVKATLFFDWPIYRRGL